MRLVAKHAQVGYQTPGERPGCRNCVHADTYRPESGVCYNASRMTCNKHGLEITSGGICNDHRVAMRQDESMLAFQRRQLDLLRQQSAVLACVPHDGEAVWGHQALALPCEIAHAEF